MNLDAAEIAARHFGITPAIAEAMVEAATVSLARRHVAPKDLEMEDGSRRERATLTWKAPSDRALMAWQDARRATEWGAEAVAVLAIEAQRGKVVLARAPRGTRVDFYIGQEGDPLERATLLEVAGQDKGSVRSLLAEKVAQAASNLQRLPAVAAVVGFEGPRVMIADARRER